MLKKVLWIFFVLMVTKFMLACCPESMFEHTAASRMELANTALDEILPDSTSVNAELFRLRWVIQMEFVAQAGFSPFAALYATSCENMGLKGLVNDIKKIELVCDQNILNTPAGVPLDLEKMVWFYEYRSLEDNRNQRISLSECLEIMNNGRYEQGRYEWYMEFQETIIRNDFLTFRMKVEMEDGAVFQMETSTVKIG